MNSEVLICCLSHQCASMCALSNENQFICILNHPGIGSCYFILFIFLRVKEAETLCLQNSVYPISFSALCNPINSK